MRAVLRAKREARRILTEAGPIKLPVPVKEIARRYAQLMEREIPGEISGMLVPIEDENEWIIVVAKSDGEVRQRFTIAHELGHLVLHSYTAPHADRGYKLRDARSSEGSVLEEIEANQFAAELLMPEGLVLDAIRREGLNYDFSVENSEEADLKVKKIARQFQVSRQAMMIRISSLLA
jgi:Zn-dependent peptidase ImmA (M78 family)